MRGFTSGHNTVWEYLKRWRKGLPAHLRHGSRILHAEHAVHHERQVWRRAQLLQKDEVSLRPDEQSFITQLHERAPEVTTATTLVVHFRQIICERQVGELMVSSRMQRSITAHYIGVGISNLIQGLSPEAVIVGGLIVRVWSLIAEDIKKAADAHLRLGLSSTLITTSRLGARPTSMGVLSIVLAAKFASFSLV